MNDPMQKVWEYVDSLSENDRDERARSALLLMKPHNREFLENRDPRTCPPLARAIFKLKEK